MKWRVFVIAIGVMALSWRGVAAADEGAGVKELEGKILESRGAIKSGEFEFRVKSSESEIDTTYHTWLSTDGRVRQERDYNGQLEVGVLTKDYWYSYFDRPINLFNPKITTIVERVPAAQARADQLVYSVCDPRAIMFSPGPFSLLSRVNPRLLVSASGRENITMKDTAWNGLPAVTVSFKVPRTANNYEYDVVPGRGYNIVAWRLTGEYPITGGGGVKFSETLSCELGEIAPNVWFPKRVVSKGTSEARPGTEEEWTIVAHAVNGEMPAEVFSIAWKLPPKRLLLESSRRFSGMPGRPGAGATEMIWDGKQMRTVTRKEVEAERASRRQSLERLGSSRGISGRVLAWVGVGAAIAAAVALAVMIWAKARGHLLDLSAAVSLLLCVAVGFVWGRSYRALDEAFLIYSVDGSEQIGVMGGKAFFQHREPQEGVRGRVLRISARSTAVDSLPPRYWPPFDKGKTAWPGAVRLAVATPGDSYWGLAVPVWHVEVLLVVVPGVWVAARVRRVKRRWQGRCAACGYDLKGNLSGVCPECGGSVVKRSHDSPHAPAFTSPLHASSPTPPPPPACECTTVSADPAR